MTVLFVIAIGVLMVAMCARYARLAAGSAIEARRHALNTAARARRAGEHTAADPAPLEVDRGAVVRPLRLVHLHEQHEQLVTAAVRRHPRSSPPAEETVTPGAAVAIDAPGVAPNQS